MRSESFKCSLDFFILPGLILLIAYVPNFAGGEVSYYEDGGYLSVINRLFHGAWYYRDICANYAPLTYSLPAAAMMMFGKTLLTLKVCFLASNILSLIVIYAISRVLIRRRFFSYLAALLIVVHAHHPYFSMHWGGFRFLFGYLFLLCVVIFQRTKDKEHAFLAGLSAALAALSSADVGLFCYGATVSLVLYQRHLKRLGSPQRFAWAVHFLSGSLSLLLPFFAVLFFSGSLRPFVREIFSFGARFVLIQPVDWSSRSALKVFTVPIIYFIAWIGLFNGRARNAIPEDEARSLTVLAFYGSATFIFSFRALAGPQFENALPAAYLTAFYLLSTLRGTTRSKRFFSAVVVSGAIVFLSLSQNMIYGGRHAWRRWWFYQTHKNEWVPHYWQIQNDPMRPLKPAIARAKGSLVPVYQASEIEEVVSWVRQNSRPDEPLFCFPELDIFNFLCDRPQISRFYFAGYALSKPEWREELFAGLVREKPRIVLTQNVVPVLAGLTGEREVLPEIRNYILTHYEKVHTAHTIDIYKLKATI